MISQHIHLLSLCICFTWLHASLSCNIEGMQVCHYHEMLNERSYLMLFTQSQEDFHEKCQGQNIFLECAFQKQHTDGCNNNDLVMLHALRNTHRLVCDNMADYVKSRPCILQIESDVISCFRPLWKTREDHCQELVTVRECIQHVMEERKECSSENMRFFGKVIDVNLIPYAHPEVYNCDMAVFGGRQENTTEIDNKRPTTHAILEYNTGSTGISTVGTTTPAKGFMSTATSQNSKEPSGNLGRAGALTWENSSSRRFLSDMALIAVLLTIVPLYMFNSY